MKLLIDTHIVFWSLIEVSQLSEVARSAIISEDNDVFVSVASAWEIAIKVGLNKWPEARPLLDGFEAALAEAKFILLPISVAHARAAGLMAARHRDPFDRLLASQAAIDDLVLVTADPMFTALGSRVIW